jgi:hypothetical protein
MLPCVQNVRSRDGLDLIGRQRLDRHRLAIGGHEFDLVRGAVGVHEYDGPDIASDETMSR